MSRQTCKASFQNLLLSVSILAPALFRSTSIGIGQAGLNHLISEVDTIGDDQRQDAEVLVSGHQFYFDLLSLF